MAIGVSSLLRVHNDDKTRGGDIPLTGRWAVIRIDLGSSQHITVPAGYNAGFCWQAAHWEQTVGQDASPVTVWAKDSIGAWNEDGSYDCTYKRDGNTLTLSNHLAAGAPKGDPTALDRAVSDAFEHAFGNNRMSVARTADNGLSVTLGDVVFSLVRES